MTATPMVVLVHGLAILRPAARMFHGVPQALEAQGFRVRRTLVQGDGSLAQLADRLWEQLAVIDGPLVLLCHSMGGLQARHLLLDDAKAPKIKAIATVGSPHHGSPLARTASLLNRAYRDMTLAARVKWHETHGEAERRQLERFGIRALSAVARLTRAARCPELLPTQALLSAIAGPNDGLVPARSQAWGEVVLETDLDHKECAVLDALPDAQEKGIALWSALARAATGACERVA